MFDKLLGGAAIAAGAFFLPGFAGAMGAGASRPRLRPEGSANNVGTQEHLVRQVIGLLNEAGIPAKRSTEPGPQVTLGAADEQAAEGAHQVAERVLLSTGYRPTTMKVGREWRIGVEPGPTKAPSADPAIRLGA